MKYEIILPYAVELCNDLKPYCIKSEIAGSIRRESPECKDIEIVCIPHKFYLEEHLNYLKHSGKIRFIKNGAKYKQFKWKSATVDLFIAAPDNWGWIYFIRTGSSDFNLKYLSHYRRMQKIPDNNKCSDDGYLRDSAGNMVFTHDEQDVFDLVGWNFTEPKYRH